MNRKIIVKYLIVHKNNNHFILAKAKEILKNKKKLNCNILICY